MTNPYQAPVANLDLPVQDGSNADPQVGGFWLRVAAKLLDFVIMLPLVGLTYWLSTISRSFYLSWIVPGIVTGLLYSVYLVRRYGGTPGKLVMKLRVQMKDGAPVSLTAALIREAPVMLLGAAINLGLGLSALSMDDATYLNYGFLARSEALMASGPGWLTAVNWSMQGWTWLGAIVMLLNSRRRAVHDFLAGTVVVKLERKS
ncbi:RDD family protein [Pseudoduganella sp. R-32]|uniref:RDD family protein n=1 Tax=Pseudoduganella sp. R-32 TaxID=3404061 RepID=UPI003CF9271D